MSRQKRKSKMPVVQKVMIVFIVLALAVLAGLVVYGLQTINRDPADEPDINIQEPGEDEPPATPDFTPRPRPELDTGIVHYNPLTGEPMDLGKTRARPIAVVLNNLSEALPLNGISEADIIYEYPVEGGLSRMLAIYQDISGVEKVGSIRSARHYSIQIAASYDAILVSAGRSPQAAQEARALDIPWLNEVEGPLRDVFFRDRNRIPGRRVESLHSVVITGERVMHWLPEYDFRLMHEEGYDLGLVFTEDGAPQGGFSAVDVVARFSSGRATNFTYDSRLNTYRMRQGNTDFTDANDNATLEVTNILILKTSVTNIRGDGSGRLNVETVGSGDGYFVSGGKYVEITWSRKDLESPFVYTLRDDSLIELGIGKTYICIIPDSMSATFE